MKKILLIVPMVLMIAGGCSNDTTEVVEKEPVVDVVEQERKTEDSTVVEKDAPKEETSVEKETPKEVAPVTGGGTDGEPMDDISDEPIISPNEKVGYITKIEKTDAGSKLTVDFAEMIIDDSHDVGFYIDNKEVGKDTVVAGSNVQVFVLNGSKLTVSSVEKLADKKGTLFTFVYNDAEELFMIEEKYLP